MIYLNISKNFLWGYVNMLSLTFYKGVPFDREQQNVLFVDNEKRNEFLSNYIVPIQTLEIKQFALLGTTNNPFLVVSLDKEPFNVNYLKVIQTIEKTGEERMLFYYIDNYEMVTPENVRLNLTMDFFQTYFNKYDMQENKMERPEIKNALVMQGHGFENGGETEEMIQPDKVTELYNFTPFSTTYRIVIHATTESPLINETCFISRSIYSFDSATRRINNLFNYASGIVKTATTETQVNIKILNAYLIPTSIIDYDNNGLRFTNFALFYFADNTQSVGLDFIFYISNLSDTGSEFYDETSYFNDNVFTITPERAKTTMIGTGKTNIELANNGKSYDCKVLIRIANDVAITMFCDKQIKSITNDFEINVVIDEYATYMSQTKNTREIAMISKVVGGAGAIGVGTGQLMTGNPMGIATMIGGVAGAGLSIAQEQATYNDMATRPATISNDTDNLIILSFLYGFGVLTLKPANYNDILTYDNYFGFKMNGFNSTLDISAQNENQKFRYCQCGYLSLIGNFDYEIKERLESYFKRGIRIWYDKDNYLNGFEP